MKGKILTRAQQATIAGLLTGLVAALDKKGFPWNKQHRNDITAAFSALGVPPPFHFETEAAPAKPNRWAGIKKLFTRSRV